MRALLVCVLTMVLAACAPRPLDRDIAFGGSRAEKGAIDDVPVKGFMATIFRTKAERITGELIAVSDSRVFVLDEGDVSGVSFNDIDRVVVILDQHHAMVALLSTWGALGTISTLSHGFVLIISAPSWAVMSTVAASSDGAPMQTEASDGQFARLAAYARFPQGLPPNVMRVLR